MQGVQETVGWYLDLRATAADLSGVIAARREAVDDREVRLCLADVAPRRWPGDEEIAALVAGGVAVVEIQGEVALDAEDAAGSLEFLRFLRDSLSHGLRVHWNGRIGAGLPVRSLSHLTPPSGGATLAFNPAVAAWRRRFTYGRCYWRSGPGFAQVSDSRGGRTDASWTLSDAPTLDLFLRLMQPTDIADCGEREAVDRALATLCAREIVVRLGDRLLSLPYRLRHWPVMYRPDRDDLRATFEPREAR
jgi:Family of unknown function (DUF5825)